MSPHLKVEYKIKSGPNVAGLATSTPPIGGSLKLESRRQNQKWLTSGRMGYITPTIQGLPNGSNGGTKSELAHKWADWLQYSRCPWVSQHFRGGDRIRIRPQAGGWDTPPLPVRGSVTFHSKGQNQNWPTEFDPRSEALWTPEAEGCVANSLTCGPLRILLPPLNCWGLP